MEREKAALKTLTPAAAKEYLARRAVLAEKGVGGKQLKIEMQFEHEFVKAGGLLIAGCDPSGYGGVVPGFCDQRNVELLAEAGFTPVEANPAETIEDIEKVEIVFKDGIGYDPAALIQSVSGLVGLR